MVNKVGARALEILEAVGLLNRSATPGPRLVFFTGGAGDSGRLPALARDAAVGAKRRDEGVFGREGVAAEEGVLGRAVEGVLDRAGVLGVGRWEELEEGLGFVVAA